MTQLIEQTQSSHEDLSRPDKHIPDIPSANNGHPVPYLWPFGAAAVGDDPVMSVPEAGAPLPDLPEVTVDLGLMVEGLQAR